MCQITTIRTGGGGTHFPGGFFTNMKRLMRAVITVHYAFTALLDLGQFDDGVGSEDGNSNSSGLRRAIRPVSGNHRTGKGKTTSCHLWIITVIIIRSFCPHTPSNSCVQFPTIRFLENNMHSNYFNNVRGTFSA